MKRQFTFWRRPGAPRQPYSAFSSIEISSRMRSDVNGANIPTPYSERSNVPEAATPSHSPW
jgi:hypothetical protein